MLKKAIDSSEISFNNFSQEEPELFDNPKPANKGRISILGIVLRQAVMVCVIIGVYFLIKTFLPNLFAATDDFFEQNVGHSIVITADD
ncbi:MAG: hypothetical protein FWH05_03655 [Oscillospiraceae bacterium]|nr:hypothetical protein [Oscillospiraceae bacterium]